MKGNKGWMVIWFAAIWKIWLERNDVVFSSNQKSVDSALKLQVRTKQVNRIQYGLVGKKKGWTCSFSEWCQNPSRCLIPRSGGYG
ncbi:hypothetical protein SLA2020_328560 [Shorea laevis]